ncbi:MAG: cytochrome c oxidase subunit 3 [Saprospirales bacterium]|nr:cytochrome c oxidase subunit 3 [Saprospirales bacterium]
MATDTALDHHADVQDGNLWDGAKSPFQASYGKLMMWYFLLSDAFTFAGFLISYGALRFSMPTWPVPDFVFKSAPFGVENAPLIFVTFMTFVLIISSVTMVRAVQEGHRENKGGAVFWLLLTIIGGATFLSSQAWEWTNLIGKEGMSVTTNPFSNFNESGKYLSAEELEKAGFQKVETEAHGAAATYFLRPRAADVPENRYFVKADHHGHSMAGEEFAAGNHFLITYNHANHLYEHGAYMAEDGHVKKEEFGPQAFGALFFFITGFHGFHVFSGVVFLTIIAINVAGGLYVKRRNGYEMVEKMGLYWHFVDLVWVFVFLVFYLL